MKIQEFCKTNKIKFVYQAVGTRTNNQTKKTIDYFMPTSYDIFLTDEYKKFQQKLKLDTYRSNNFTDKFTSYRLAIDTNDIHRLDIDNQDLWDNLDLEVKDAVKNSPYNLSRNKRLPHYYIKIKNLPPNAKRRYVLKNKDNEPVGDLLTGQWSWVKCNEKIKQSSNPIPEISFNELIKNYPTKNKKASIDFKCNLDCFHPMIQNDINYIIEFLKLIKIDIGFTPNTNWYKIGNALSQYVDILINIPNFLEESKKQVRTYFFNIYDCLSSKASNYNKDQVKKVFYDKSDCKMDIGIIYKFAKKSNPILYKELMTLKKACKTNTIVQMGKIIKQLYPDFRAISAKEFYICKSGIWKKTRCQKYIYKLLDKFKQRILDITSEDYHYLYTDNIMITSILRGESSVNTFLKNIMSFLIDEKLLMKLNNQEHIFPLKDKKINLLTGKLEDYKAEDYISITSPYTSEEFLNTDVNLIDNFLKNIFPSNENRRYYLNLFSQLLYGRNRKEIFIVFSGKGANGKSLLLNYFSKIFGDLYIEIPVQMLTSKKISTSCANPYLGMTRYSRVISFNEPEEGSKVNNAFIKELTGGDEITTRNLFSDPFKFRPNFTPIIACNSAFKLQDSSDRAMERRLIYIKFGVNFVENPKNKNEKKIDYSLKNSQKITIYSLQLLKLLFDNYQELQKNDFNNPIPKSVIKNKQIILSESDIVQQYIEENITKTDNNKKFIKYMDLYKDYRQYCAQNNEFAGSKNAVKNRFITKLGTFFSQKKINGKNYKSIFTNVTFTGINDKNQFSDF